MITEVNKNWIEKLSERLGPPIFTEGDEVRFNCFKDSCGSSGEKDTHKHMYVNPVRGKYFCQKCQRGGTLDYLCSVLSLPMPEEDLSVWAEVMYSYLFGPNGDSKPVETVPEPDTSEIYPGTLAVEYLRTREIGESRVKYYNIRMGVKKLRNRIVFPDFSVTGDLVYWVARDYVGRDPKYRNAKCPKNGKLYNATRWGRAGGKTVVICEGVISAIVTGVHAVATYGKYVTGEQVRSLRALDADDYVVAFDGDAIEYGASLASRLRKLGCSTRVVRLPALMDPADVGFSEMKSRVANAVEVKTDFDAVELLL